MTESSMLRRLSLHLIIIGILALALTIVLMASEFHDTARVLRDRGLSGIAQAIGENSVRMPDGRIVVDLPPEIATRIEGEDFEYTINDIYGQVLAAKPADLTAALHPFQPHAEGKLEYFQHVGDGEEDYFGVTTQSNIDGEAVWIQVSEGIEDPDSPIRTAAVKFISATAIIALPFFVISVLLTIWSFKRSLRPLEEISQQAAKITPATVGRRLNTTNVPQEIRPLVDAFNGALERLEHAFDAQRKFTADAAHELLTPLAVMKAHVDLMPDRKQAVEISKDIAHMTESVNQLLELAELEAATTPLEDDVELQAIAIEIINMMRPIAVQQGVELKLTSGATPVLVKGCAKALARALRNLVENALRHATGATLIEVQVEPPGKIHVVDNGPGIAAEHQQSIFERFSRPAQGEQEGSGLGLAIVREIVQRHGGTVELHDAPNGGARFTIDLPAANEG